MCMFGEISRFPIFHNSGALAIKYWHLLCTGLRNAPLNECFEICKKENQWVLKWINPLHTCDKCIKEWKALYCRRKKLQY